MKLYAINDLCAGMMIGMPIYTSQGQLIFEAGTVLTNNLISRLSFYGISEVMIQEQPEKEPEKKADSQPKEEPEKDSAPASYIDSQQSRSQKLMRKPAFQKFQVDYSKEVASLQTSLSGILKDTGQDLDTNELLQSMGDLSRSSQSTIDLFDMLYNMRQINDSIYSHSVNVSLIARMMGKWLHFSEDDLQTLVLCGLLHDIGKTALPIELLNKPGKYTPEEFETVKRHPTLGYQILRDQKLDTRIKNAVLMHHERCDGSGYPQGLKKEQLDDFAMLIAIADVYDAMTTARSYRKPLCPFQVIDAFEKEGLQKYHPKYILTFLEHIADTYQHNRVLLNNGQSGKIVMINKQHLTQPYIQFDDNSIIDMTSHKELEIISIL